MSGLAAAPLMGFPLRKGMRNTGDQYQKMDDKHTCGTVSSRSPNGLAKGVVFMVLRLLDMKTSRVDVTIKTAI